MTRFAIVALLALTACERVQPDPHSPPTPVPRLDAYLDTVRVWTDPVTRCEYLIVSGTGSSTSMAITPRLSYGTNGMCRARH